MIALDFIDLILVVGLMAIAIALSAWQHLGLEVSLAIAAARTIVQLGIVGYGLAIVFDLESPNTGVTLAFLLVLSLLVAVVTRNRISRTLPHLFFWVWGSLLLSTVLVVSYAQFLIIQPPNWADPQYLVPLVAVILGNGMNGAAIAGEHLVNALNYNQTEIETHLSLGATPQRSVSAYRRAAIRAGLAPGLNSMMIVGIVTLPGILSGQLLAGASPLDAVSYQILLLFLGIVAELLIGLILTSRICRQFFSPEAQLQKF
ncbi:MAG: ABC transporter permease [Microcoleaceae cyanobacterium]